MRSNKNFQNIFRIEFFFRNFFFQIFRYFLKFNFASALYRKSHKNMWKLIIFSIHIFFEKFRNKFFFIFFKIFGFFSRKIFQLYSLNFPGKITYLISEKRQKPYGRRFADDVHVPQLSGPLLDSQILALSCKQQLRSTDNYRFFFAVPRKSIDKSSCQLWKMQFINDGRVYFDTFE